MGDVMATYKLTFNDTPIHLPQSIDPEWELWDDFPDGYYLEEYTDELHLMQDGKNDPVAAWQNGD
jgi:hypothetical protein